jgi:hypothetical protein
MTARTVQVKPIWLTPASDTHAARMVMARTCVGSVGCILYRLDSVAPGASATGDVKQSSGATPGNPHGWIHVSPVS